VVPDRSELVLVCAPFGRDAELIRRVIAAASMEAVVVTSVAELCAGIQDGAATAVIADEVLSPNSVAALTKVLAGQPRWSDFPLIVMTSGGDTTEASRYRLRLLEPLGNLSLLERPLRTATLLSSVRSVLRARRHQYEIAFYMERLTKTNRQLEEFAYVASHDMQEPLRVVNIFTEKVLRRCAAGDTEAQKFTGFVQSSIARMENLLRDLLSFSRTIAHEPVSDGSADLRRCVEQAMATLNGRAEESEAEVTWGPLPVVFGEEAQLTQVFQNMLSNALKYRKAGVRPRIRVSAEQRGDEWEIAVSDNGIGFDSKYSERIFGLFKRLHKDEYPGTGLGLAICQRIVERYGGRISAEGRPGEGAVFRVVLRGVPEAPPAEAKSLI